jgi:3-carboxy-cis,cis-muconate cycloisomerase
MVPELCVLSHGALSQAIFLLQNLVVRPERMTRNLALSEGLIASEAVMMRLGPVLGRQQAHDVVYDACMEAFEHDRSLREILLAVPEVAAAVTPDELDQLLDPRNYTGLAGRFVDRVLSLV